MSSRGEEAEDDMEFINKNFCQSMHLDVDNYCPPGAGWPV